MSVESSERVLTWDHLYDMLGIPADALDGWRCRGEGPPGYQIGREREGFDQAIAHQTCHRSLHIIGTRVDTAWMTTPPPPSDSEPIAIDFGT